MFFFSTYNFPVIVSPLFWAYDFSYSCSLGRENDKVRKTKGNHISFYKKQGQSISKELLRTIKLTETLYEVTQKSYLECVSSYEKNVFKKNIFLHDLTKFWQKPFVFFCLIWRSLVVFSKKLVWDFKNWLGSLVWYKQEQKSRQKWLQKKVCFFSLFWTCKKYFEEA